MSFRTLALAVLLALTTGCDEEERQRLINEFQRRQAEIQAAQQAQMMAALAAAQNRASDTVAENKTVQTGKHQSDTVLILTGCGLAAALYCLMRRKPRHAP